MNFSPAIHAPATVDVVLYASETSHSSVTAARAVVAPSLEITMQEPRDPRPSSEFRLRSYLPNAYDSRRNPNRRNGRYA